MKKYIICLLILLLVISTRCRRIIKRNDKIKKSKVLLSMLCTPNYNYVCNDVIDQVEQYAKVHKYNFVVGRRNLNSNLHINFSRFELIKRLIEHTDHDYYVIMDADSQVHHDNISIEDLITNYSDNPNALIFAPLDVVGGWSFGSFSIRAWHTTLINGGLMIFHRNALPYIKDYLYMAEHTKCGQYWNDVHPRCQNVWDHCFAKKDYYKSIFSYIPWELVGVRASTFISQTFETQYNEKDKNAVINNKLKTDEPLLHIV